MTKKWFPQVESWFVERGYERTDFYFEDTGESWVQYSMRSGGLVFRITITPYREEAGVYLTSVSYYVRVVTLGDLPVALVERSRFSSVPEEHLVGWFASRPSSHSDKVGLPWSKKKVWLESRILGDRWEKLLGQLEHDLPVVWSALADAEDLCAAVDESPYWSWYQEGPGRLFAMLYQKRWDDALEYVRSWTYDEINPRGMGIITSSSLWTAQEELDNAVRVVAEYVDQHRE
ncbi:MAG: hypothetical protein Q4A82_02780 [Corynebacterium sp.]|nr:hypothetical protein [Corynebacterium sp.]